MKKKNNYKKIKNGKKQNIFLNKSECCEKYKNKMKNGKLYRWIG